MTDLPEPDPFAADRRRSRRRALIPDEAACALCGYANPDGLHLQDDHPLGWKMADEVRVWLCVRCHAEQSADRLDHHGGAPAGRTPQPLTFLERFARALRSIAVFLHALAHSAFQAADKLRTTVDGLDEHAPGWRAAGWAA